MTLADESIECRYEITKDDYLVLNAALMYVPNRHTPLMFLRLSIFAIFVVIVIWAFKQITGDSWYDIATGLGGGLGLGLLILYVFRRFFIRLYGRLMARTYYASDLVEKSERVLTFSENGLAIKSEKFDGQSPWKAFTSIMRTEDHFVLWQNSRQGHIIPFRALSGDDVETLWRFFEAMPVAKRVRLK